MSMLDGLDKEILSAFGGDFRDGTLFVPATTQSVSDGQGGLLPATQPGQFGCKVLVTGYSDYRRLALGIPATDRQLIVLAASLPSGVRVDKGQKLSAPDPSRGNAVHTFEIIAKTGDPAGAIYKLQGR